MTNVFLNNLAEVKVTYSHKVPASERRAVRCSRDAFQVAQVIIPMDQVEHHEFFSIILLSRSNKVLGYNRISEGGISGTIVDVRLIFQVALKTNASAIILVHNHPSGNLSPSEPDKKITRDIKEAGKLLKIDILDHIILASDNFYSMADNNLL